MSITKQEIRTKLIDHIDSAPGLYGQDGLRLVGEFMEREKICPQAIIEVIHDLRDEDYRFLDGRAIIPCIGATIPASDRKLSRPGRRAGRAKEHKAPASNSQARVGSR